MKNVKQLARQVAHDNGWDERDVQEKALYIFFRLKNHLTAMNHTAITISSIGTYQVRIDKLRVNILYSIGKIRYYGGKGYCGVSPEKRKQILEHYKEMLQRQLKVHNELALHHTRLKEYYIDKRKKKAARLAEQAENDTAGIKEAEAPASPAGLDDALPVQDIP